LIEAYIAENSKDPVTGDALTTDDLVELKTARIVRPRPPTLTSIPSLLTVFQNEWDALALESYTIRQQLAQTRQELSTALYQHDAAVRVIARLTKERDEARDALSKIAINTGRTASNGDSMQIDRQEIPDPIVSKVEATQERLSKTRRKRAVPEGWASAETIESFGPAHTSEPLYPGGRSVALDASGDLTLVGGSDGIAGVYSLSQRQVLHALKGGAAITDTLWSGSQAIVSTAAGSVKIFDKATETANFSAHAGEISALALHPSGEILASVGVDKSYVLYDLVSSTPITQIYTDSGQSLPILAKYGWTNGAAALTSAGFHPDGHLFAAGGSDGRVKVFDVKSGTNAANFEASGPIQALSFSENGTWLAVAVKGQTDVTIWDLRKAAATKTLEIGSKVENMRWDYTGQFLAVTGPSGLAVQQYSKAAKEWSEPLRSAVAGVAVEWGPGAQSLVVMSGDGVLTVMEAK